jgi:hypothetical protein
VEHIVPRVDQMGLLSTSRVRFPSKIASKISLSKIEKGFLEDKRVTAQFAAHWNVIKTAVGSFLDFDLLIDSV